MKTGLRKTKKCSCLFVEKRFLWDLRGVALRVLSHSRLTNYNGVSKLDGDGMGRSPVEISVALTSPSLCFVVAT
jgi:hypothetical protein